jgi:hypothetical protein
MENSVGPLIYSVICLPPKYTIRQEQLEDFHNPLGRRFIAGGDYNATHTDWGSRLGTLRGRELLEATERNKLKGESTYWQSASNKLAVAKSCFDLSSNHSPVFITLTGHALNQEKQPRLSNRHTDGDDFRHLINGRLALNVSLKTGDDIEAAVKLFIDTIQQTGWNTTPEHTDTLKTYEYPILIKQKIEDIRRLRRVWHRLQTRERKDYLTQQHRNSNNSSKTTSKHSCNILHQQNALIVPCGRRPRE